MKKYLILLLISMLSLGLLSCGRSKDKTNVDKQSLTNGDKKSLSGNPDTTDEKGW